MGFDWASSPINLAVDCMRVAIHPQVRHQAAALQPDRERADVDEPQPGAEAHEPRLRHRPVPPPAGALTSQNPAAAGCKRADMLMLPVNIH